MTETQFGNDTYQNKFLLIPDIFTDKIQCIFFFCNIPYALQSIFPLLTTDGCLFVFSAYRRSSVNAQGNQMVMA